MKCMIFASWWRNPMELLDLARIATMVTTVVTSGFVVMTLVYYFRKLRVLKGEGRLLPRHVINIAYSYLCYAVPVVWTLYGRLGEPEARLEIVLWLQGGITGTWAMIDIVRHLHGRDELTRDLIAKSLLDRLDAQAEVYGGR